MKTISFDILVGVVGGVLTSALIMLAISIFKKIIVPWYQNIIYRGISLSGPWHWFDEDEDSVKMELKQAGDSITGIYTYMDSKKKGDIKIYHVTGWARDRFVQLNLKSADPKRLGILSYVFEIVGDGNELRGCSVFYSTNLNKVCSDTESFYRTLELARKNANIKMEQCVPNDNKSIQLTGSVSAD